MNTSPWQIDRRTVLRGLGATIALPFLEAMVPARALAAAKLPKPPVRFAVFHFSQGIEHEYWLPETVGPIAKLPSILRPLEPWREKITLVSNLNNTGVFEGQFRSHGHELAHHLLTCSPNKTKTSAHISFDQYVARAIGRDTPVESVVLSSSSGGEGNTLSYRDAHTPLNYESNPRLVFERLFGRDASKRTAPDDRSVLDAVLDQGHALRARLGRSDQQTLDGFFETVRELERRMEIVETRQEEIRQERAADRAEFTLEGLPADEKYAIDRGDPAQAERHLKLMSDLMVLAFQTDSTRVALQVPGFGYFPDVVTVGSEFDFHVLAHQGGQFRGKRANPMAREALRQIHAWHAERFAYLVGRLDSIREGDGTLLDHCLLLFCSELGAGDHFGGNIPMLIAGGGGGTIRTGQHVAADEKTPVANLYVELANRMGIPTAQFGDSHSHPDAKHDGRLPCL